MRILSWDIVIAIVSLVLGLVAFYFGFFHADAVCNDQPRTDLACHVQAAFTNEAVFLLIGAILLVIGLWMLLRTVLKQKMT